MPMETEGHGREFGRRQKMRAKCTVEFVCKYCQRRFTKPYNLMIHERSHKDDVTFTCEVCGKSFKRQDNFKQHRYTATFRFFIINFTDSFCFNFFYFVLFSLRGFLFLRARTGHVRTRSDPWSIAAISEYSLGGPFTRVRIRIWRRAYERETRDTHTWRCRYWQCTCGISRQPIVNQTSVRDSHLQEPALENREAIGRRFRTRILRVLAVRCVTKWHNGE